MNPRRSSCCVFLVLSVVLLGGCSHNTVNNGTINNGPAEKSAAAAAEKSAAPDARSNEALKKILPDSAFDQKEFPKTYVIGMMRGCLNIVKKRDSISYQAGKSDALCACETDARVHQFSMEEYIEAGEAQWDPRVVPDASKKYAKIITGCLQRVLP